MRRKIYDTLLKWKKTDSGRCAILIDGARRVGKSYIAEEFGKKEYKSYVLIDFSRVGEDVKELFRNYIEKKLLPTFFLKLSEHFGVRLYERETLFVLRGGQVC